MLLTLTIPPRNRRLNKMETSIQERSIFTTDDDGKRMLHIFINFPQRAKLYSQNCHFVQHMAVL